jgi:hypothetical protein
MAKRRKRPNQASYQAPKEKILNLVTLSDRVQVSIDGERYDLLGPLELPLLAYHRLSRDADRLRDFFKDDCDPSEDDEKELSSTLDRICRKVLSAPDEIHERLNDFQRLDIVNAFTGLRRQRLQVPERSKEAQKTQTGVS